MRRKFIALGISLVVVVSIVAITISLKPSTTDSTQTGVLSSQTFHRGMYDKTR